MQNTCTKNDLVEVLKDIAVSHSRLITAQSHHDRLVREIAILKGELANVSQALATVRLENLSLRKQIRHMGQEPYAVGVVAGDSR